MKHVLVIAPCFAPSSLPPALRNRLFLLHLETLGWKPVVLTVEPACLEDSADTVFLEMIPKNLEILRTRAFRRQWTRKIGVGDLGLRSFWQLCGAAKKLCRERKIDLLFISGPPWVPFLVGTLIKKKFKIPYVLDYIDPWVSPKKDWKGGILNKRVWAEQMALVLDPVAVRRASAVVSVSEGINSFMRGRYPAQAHKVEAAIPYGIEPSDFDFVRAHSRPNGTFEAGNSLRHIVYVGVVWPNAYETLKAIFSAVRKIKNENTDIFKSMRWHFIGTSYAPHAAPQILPMAKTFGVEEIMTEIPQRVSYPSALQSLVDADVVLAFGSNDPTYTSSKIFPCILAKKPILAVYHEKSSVVEIMQKTQAGEAVTFSDERPVDQKSDEIKKSIYRVMIQEGAQPRIDWESFEKYSALNMTRKLVKVFDRCVQGT